MIAAPPTPLPKKQPAWLLPGIGLAYAGGTIAYLPLLSLLLPARIDAIAGDARLGVLTAGLIAGALAASVSNIIFGMLSDRSLARGGGRRAWLAAGLVATALAYAGIAHAASPVTIVLAIAAFQFAVNALLAPLLAIMADEVPDAQKGVTGGLLALGAPAASAVGALLFTVDGLDMTARLAIVPLVSALCIMPLLLIRGSPDAGAEAKISSPPTPSREFVIASGARLLVQIAGNVLALYLLFYFESVVPAVSPEALSAAISHLLILAYLAPLPIALVAGRLSDRSGRRKPFLIAAAGAAAAGLAGMAWADDWTSGAVAFTLYTIGSSVFLALHAAFAMQLLPSARHRGRDLGLLNLTNTLPALAGPLLTWSLATPDNFAPVMVVLAGLTMAGGLVMLAVRGRG